MGVPFTQAVLCKRMLDRPFRQTASSLLSPFAGSKGVWASGHRGRPSPTVLLLAWFEPHEAPHIPSALTETSTSNDAHRPIAKPGTKYNDYDSSAYIVCSCELRETFLAWSNSS